MKRLSAFTSNLADLFTTPINTWQHLSLIGFTVLFFIRIIQFPISDWLLNTAGLWEDGLRIYELDPNRVYPPWGLILLLPYYLMNATGSRIASVLVVAWLSWRRGWSVLLFWACTLNLYFLYTMSKSNMDILVLVLPVLLWEEAEGKRWQGLGQGFALSLLLLKPQGALLLFPYLLWKKREQWKELIFPLSVVALITIPISLAGQPALILQWLDNIANPSIQNQTWWAINNLSLTAETSLPVALGILILAGLAVYSLAKSRHIHWTQNHSLASLLIISMFLSPYTSNQMFSAALVFVPSWGLNAVIFTGLTILNFTGTFWGNTVLLAFPVSLAALYLHKSSRPKSIAS